MFHRNSTLNHKIENWTYANAAARTAATGFVTGDIGKLAFQTDNVTYWRLTAVTPTWVQALAGPAGANGTNGTNGSIWRDGSGVPSNSLGIDGDYYLRTTNGDVYLRGAGVYTVVGNIKGATGAAGSAGAAGPGVPTAGTAGQVLAKIDSTNYNTEWVTPAGGGGGGPLNLFNHTATQYSVSTDGTLDTLWSDNLGADRLTANFQKILASYACSFLNHATATRRFVLYFGTDIIFDSGALVFTAGTRVRLDVWIMRESANVIRCSSTFITDNATHPCISYFDRITGLTLTDDIPLILKVAAAGTGAAADDIDVRMAYGQFLST